MRLLRMLMFLTFFFLLAGKVYEGEIQAFVVKVELPRMEAAQEADVDITTHSLSLEVPGRSLLVCVCLTLRALAAPHA